MRFGVRLQSIMNHCDSVVDMIVIQIPTSQDTGLLALIHTVTERENCLSSEIFGNTLLYPNSVRDCPGPEHAVLYCYFFHHIFRICYPIGDLTSQNLLSFTYLVLSPHHPPQNHTPKPYIIAAISHIVITLIILL